MDIQIASEGDDHPPPTDIEQWINTAIGSRMEHAQVCLRIVGEAEITELNNTYRHQDKATNVLSFPADLPDHIELPLLGDIVICAPVVEQEARTQGKPSGAHWAHMIIHGTLHLLGYDHIEQQDAEIMEKLEIELLASIDIDNPYLATH